MQKFVKPSISYGCRFAEQIQVAFVIVCLYQRAHKNASLRMSAYKTCLSAAGKAN
jgi:hypothetical protein